MLDRILRGLVKPINPYASVIIAGLAVLWGVWLTLFSTNLDATGAMASALPLWVWGLFSSLYGVSLAYSMAKGMYRLFMMSLLTGVWYWFAVMLMLWVGDWRDPLAITYTFIYIYSVYIYLNVKVNYCNDEGRLLRKRPVESVFD